MRRGKVSAVIPATCAEAFDLIHDYDRRLEWDTLLRAAYLDDGFTEAGKGVTSVCVGRRAVGGLAVRTRYVSFDRPKLAAVEMINLPPLFSTWAASIRHAEETPGSSRVTYTFSFRARPRWLAWLFEPIMLRVFHWETKKRLKALAAYFAARN